MLLCFPGHWHYITLHFDLQLYTLCVYCKYYYFQTLIQLTFHISIITVEHAKMGYYGATQWQARLIERIYRTNEFAFALVLCTSYSFTFSGGG